ncbi:uncharacterized protein A4U43_C05F4570 [Asparagus officinalis]|uniref:Pulmonary surfactant-associated protein B n=2 Tax=Asparagus officinalis TaxID=4686 RepID=A0A5P1ETJ3_ASPOF|nr:uncharacterized protein A4U43_C05F4570 [Asparagus officinalis]
MWSLCQEYAAQVVEFFSKNETKSDIISTLHQACSRLHDFKHECALMVDYFAPLFFTEISTTQPELFREKVNLCGKMVPVSLPKRSDACTLCHHVVAEVLNKLHMPDTQLEIIETLMKGCSKLQDFVQECKQLVFQYGPAIVAKAEKYLEGKDICAHIHECKSASLGDLLLSSA